MAKSRTAKPPKMPKLPGLTQRKIYKTGQTRGADDDVIYQNRVNRNSTVLIPYSVYNICSKAPDNDGVYQSGFIVLIKPEDYFDRIDFQNELATKNITVGVNALLFYETREQWNKYNPDEKDFNFAISRTNPLAGQYAARVPSTTSDEDEKINRGFTTSGSKGAGIRVYEYASSNIIKSCMFQLEYLYWKCYNAIEVSEIEGMSKEDIAMRSTFINETVKELKLDDDKRLTDARIIDSEGHTTCPLCLEKLSAKGFYSRLEQAEGRDVPDLTVTQINLFHIRELRTGEFNHKPYNLGWGHHHCNVVTKDSGILETLKWMATVVDRNETKGYIVR